MMNRPLNFVSIFALAAGLVLTSGCSTVRLDKTADSLYLGGDILTMKGDQPSYAEALAVKDGKILFVGTKAEALKLKGDGTEIRDLGGKALLPGFLDAHSHYINSLLVANQCKLYAPPSGPGKDVPSIIAELKKYAAERNIPKGEMIMGYGYDDTVMPDGRLLNRDDLDAGFSRQSGPHRSRLDAWRGDEQPRLEEIRNQRGNQDPAGRRDRAQAGH